MRALRFETAIRAGREKEWRTMLDQPTYRIGTAEFTPGSYYEGSWEEGARIRFSRAVSASGVAANSIPNVATTMTFTDAPLAAGIPVCAVHLAAGGWPSITCGSWWASANGPFSGPPWRD